MKQKNTRIPKAYTVNNSRKEKRDEHGKRWASPFYACCV